MALKKLVTSADVRKLRVTGGGTGEKRIGKVRYCVFHPREKRCIGFVVKRPDLALMFHRKDLFVALDGFDLIDGCVVVRQDAAASGPAACRRLGVDWNECVIWDGMPLMTADEKPLGLVGSVTFCLETGQVEHVEVSNGATAKYLLGTLEVPANLIMGFKRGIGVELTVKDDAYDLNEEEEAFRGAILVSDEVWALSPEGGWAEAAGEFTAKTASKAKETAEKVAQKAKPKVQEVTTAAGDAINEGAFAVGKQVAASKGMFSSFKDEFEKACSGQDEEWDDAEEEQDEPQEKAPAVRKAPRKATGFGGMFASFKEEYNKAVRDE